MSQKAAITLNINGRGYPIEVESRRTLADAIREDCGQTGTHIGCEHGICGACTVIVNGDPVRSCLMFAVQADGGDILTIEGMAAADGTLHALQEGFREMHGLQCGFCTPGMIMRAAELLKNNPNPTEEEIRWGIAGNLCRCTGYNNIVKAIQYAGAKLRGEEVPAKLLEEATAEE